MNFQIGEILVYCNCTQRPQLNGTECEVLALPQDQPWIYTGPACSYPVKIGAGCYVTHSSLIGKALMCTPKFLRRKQLPDKPREALGNWEDCPWSPIRVNTTVTSELVLSINENLKR